MHTCCQGERETCRDTQREPESERKRDRENEREASPMQWAHFFWGSLEAMPLLNYWKWWSILYGCHEETLGNKMSRGQGCLLWRHASSWDLEGTSLLSAGSLLLSWMTSQGPEAEPSICHLCFILPKWLTKTRKQNMVRAWAFLSRFPFLMFPSYFLSAFTLFLYSPVQFSLTDKVVFLNWEERNVLGLECRAGFFSLSLFLIVVVGFVPLPASARLGCCSSEASALLLSLLRWAAVPGGTEYRLLLCLPRPCQSGPAGQYKWLSPSQRPPWMPPLALSGCLAFFAYLPVPWLDSFSFPLLFHSLTAKQDLGPSFSRDRSKGLIFILTREPNLRLF